MKKWMKWILCLGVLLFCVQAASAYTVRQISVPKTDLKANENVNLELQLSIGSFTSTHFLQFSSDLTDTNLVVQRYHEDTGQYENIQVDLDRTGKWILYGWLLQSDNSYVLQLSFSGRVSSSASGNITLIRISELSGESVVSGSDYIIHGQVVNPQEITSQISNVRTELQKFKDDITSQGSTGIDVTAASNKAKEAENALAEADSLKSSSYTQAAAKISTARTAIQDGNTLLEKAGAEYQIHQVERTMADVESMVSYFTVNRSVSQTDSRLIAITNKYDLASQSISSANDLVSSGNYLNGKAKAAEAAKYANDAYNLSTTLKTELGEGIGLPGINPMFLALGLGVIVIGVVGYFAYRKFVHWDELG
jgi:hypothetical protein